MLLDNFKFRIDSEFFMKKYIKSYEEIKRAQHTQLKNELAILTDFHANGSYESIADVFELLDEPNYAYMVRSTDLETKNYKQNVKYVTKAAYDFLSKSQLFGGEVLINKIGSPGRTYLMPKLNMPVSLGLNLFLLKLKDNSRICNKVLWLYLNTAFGKLIIDRHINGTVPLSLDKNSVRNIYVPIFSQKIQNLLQSICDRYDEYLTNAKKMYSKSEELLLSYLNITNYTENLSCIAIKSFKSSFGISGRLDSEYYQPKYEELLSKIDYSNRKKLGDIVDIKKSIEPGSDHYQDEGVPFIRVSNLSKFEITDPEIKIPINTASNISGLYLKKDTILLSKDGSVGIAYKVQHDMQSITSGAILHLSIKNTNEVLPDYLTLVLNSKIVQMQAERDSGGSIIKHWKPSEIENVIIPILDMDKQKEIAKNLQKSFALRKQSAELLELAKKAVEIAIEKDEEKAVELLKGAVDE